MKVAEKYPGPGSKVMRFGLEKFSVMTYCFLFYEYLYYA
jgi:hypothetical protein